MSGSKIQLSKEELDLVKNSEWILTKNSVIEKLVLGLGELSVMMEERLVRSEKIIPLTSPRISRGEKYEGLPYLVLDYPRFFSQIDIFAIRTFFWWGKHCSISLHTKGRFLSMAGNGLRAKRQILDGDSYYLATSGNEWVHNLEADPYLLLKDLNDTGLADQLKAANFIRVGKMVPFGQWEEMKASLYKGFDDLLRMISL